MSDFTDPLKSLGQSAKELGRDTLHNFVDDAITEVTAPLDLSQQYLHIRHFYNFIRARSGQNVPTPFFYFCPNFYTYAPEVNMDDGLKNVDSFLNRNTGNFARFRYCIQSIDVPQLQYKGQNGSRDIGQGNSTINEVYGVYSYMTNSFVHPSQNTFTMRILNVGKPVIEDFIYPWMLEAARTTYGGDVFDAAALEEELKKNGETKDNIKKKVYTKRKAHQAEVADLTPIPRVNMAIKFWTPNLIVKDMEGTAPSFIYFFTGIFPITINTHQPVQTAGNNDSAMNRQVTFAFNDFVILNSSETSFDLGSFLTNPLYSLVDKYKQKAAKAVHNAVDKLINKIDTSKQTDTPNPNVIPTVKNNVTSLQGRTKDAGLNNNQNNNNTGDEKKDEKKESKDENTDKDTNKKVNYDDVKESSKPSSPNTDSFDFSNITKGLSDLASSIKSNDSTRTNPPSNPTRSPSSSTTSPKLNLASLQSSPSINVSTTKPKAVNLDDILNSMNDELGYESIEIIETDEKELLPTDNSKHVDREIVAEDENKKDDNNAVDRNLFSTPMMKGVSSTRRINKASLTDNEINLSEQKDMPISNEKVLEINQLKDTNDLSNEIYPYSTYDKSVKTHQTLTHSDSLYSTNYNKVSSIETTHEDLTSQAPNSSYNKNTVSQYNKSSDLMSTHPTYMVNNIGGSTLIEKDNINNTNASLKKEINEVKTSTDSFNVDNTDKVTYKNAR